MTAEYTQLAPKVVFGADPAPLILSRRKIVVSFSPKSACTHTLVWFLRQEGLEDQARDYHQWPHRFRVNCYYKLDAYSRNLADAIAHPADYTLLKVTRTPSNRLVSQYRHSLRHNLVDDAMSARFDIDAKSDGYSLAQFSHFLSSIDRRVVSRTDSHLCEQFHPAWMFPFGQVITVNADTHNVSACLNQVEERFDLPVTDFRDTSLYGAWSKAHHRPKEQAARADDLFFRPFSKADAKLSFPTRALQSHARTHRAADQLFPLDARHSETSADFAGACIDAPRTTGRASPMAV